MPLKLQAPRAGKTPNYYIVGTYLGVGVNQSTGTGRKRIAAALLRKREREIERGAVAGPGAPTFAGAAVSYMQAGGERRPLKRILPYLGTTKLADIDQAAIDAAGAALLPNAGSATRNREIYTPVSAVLKHAGIEMKIRRPKGWRGRRMTHWLTPEKAFRIFKAANKIKVPKATRRRFRALLVTLCYTGMRLSEPLRLVRRDIDLNAATALLYDTKNREPRLVHLPPVVMRELRPLIEDLEDDVKVFGFHAGGRLRDMLKMTLELAGVTLPKRVAFHVFCHTWATWMRLYGNLDTWDLVETDRWKDPDSAARYSHVMVSEAAKRADLLPVEKRRAR